MRALDLLSHRAFKHGNVDPIVHRDFEPRSNLCFRVSIGFGSSKLNLIEIHNALVFLDKLKIMDAKGSSKLRISPYIRQVEHLYVSYYDQSLDRC